MRNAYGLRATKGGESADSGTAHRGPIHLDDLKHSPGGVSTDGTSLEHAVFGASLERRSFARISRTYLQLLMLQLGDQHEVLADQSPDCGHQGVHDFAVFVSPTLGGEVLYPDVAVAER